VWWWLLLLLLLRVALSSVPFAKPFRLGGEWDWLFGLATPPPPPPLSKWVFMRGLLVLEWLVLGWLVLERLVLEWLVGEVLLELAWLLLVVEEWLELLLLGPSFDAIPEACTADAAAAA
jgi:hypothetical protein